MKSLYIKIYLAAFVFLLGCSEADNLQLSLNTDTLSVISVIPCSESESLCIGVISDLVIYNDSIVGVLDRISASCFLFTIDGAYLRNVGLQGNGPGELVNPNGLIIQNDIVYIFDSGSGKVCRYTIDGTFLNETYFEANSVPLWPMLIDSINYVGIDISYKSIDTEMYCIYTIAAYTLESANMYPIYSDTMIYDPNDLTTYLNSTLYSHSVTANGVGSIYFAAVDEDVCEVVMAESNSMQTVYRFEYAPKYRTQEEIEEESAIINRILASRGNSGYAYNYRCRTYRSLIAPNSLYADSNYIYILDGRQYNNSIHVYDKEFELQKYLKLGGLNAEDVTEHLWLYLSENYIACFNMYPEMDSRVLIYPKPGV
ncbi:MAG TPA: 6-bladed beta-propeller [Candidatus Sabulitectum sp.]|nr:6-bladed beta-propeller [Candidatus Sabulitectum sp.]